MCLEPEYLDPIIEGDELKHDQNVNASDKENDMELSDYRVQLPDHAIVTKIEQHGTCAGEDLGRIWRIRRNGYDWIGGFASIKERDTEFERLARATPEEIDEAFQ